jgi:hypothetical protein
MNRELKYLEKISNRQKITVLLEDMEQNCDENKLHILETILKRSELIEDDDNFIHIDMDILLNFILNSNNKKIKKCILNNKKEIRLILKHKSQF